MIDLAARSHPLRAALSAEMHARALPAITPPCRILQVVTLTDGDASDGRHSHIAALATAAGGGLAPGARYAAVPFAGGQLVWEGHAEFATYTFVHPGLSGPWFDAAAFGPETAAALADLPGQVIRATLIAVLAVDGHLPDGPALAGLFGGRPLVVGDMADGTARIVSDFGLHEDGFGRLLVADHGLAGIEAAQAIVRLQELGNYRNMALLGLPVAQRAGGELGQLERRLAALGERVAERASEDEALLDELTAISAELARVDAATRYRMSATRAYGELALARLASLEATAVRGYQSLAGFTERRLVPALATCASFTRRVDDLSQRAAWAGELLRTRVDIALARQNRDLLASVDARTAAQVRLQQAVEGLSVVAITYYAVALIGYLAWEVPGVDQHVVLAVAVPVVLLAAWLFIHRLRQSLGTDRS